MKRFIPVAALAAGVLAVGGAGIAFASIPDGGGVIHACYKPNANGSNAALGVIDTALSGGHCPAGDTQLTWNQTGPQGPAGPTGPQGATGPQGPAGPSTGGPTGLDLTWVSNNSSGTTVKVFCPADHPYLFGGGGDGGSNILASFPITESGQQGWELVDQVGINSTAYAICGK